MNNVLKEKLELAALVDGRSFEWMCRGANNPSGEPNVPCLDGGEWAPQDDDADSRRLEIACLNWVAENPLPDGVDEAHYNYIKPTETGDLTPEIYRAAVLDLAVAIGRVIKEQDHD